MIIKHNMQSANTMRNLKNVDVQMGRHSEKLNSGYRINRAADNTAGLAISEEMRTQVRGLNRGSLNAQDAISYTRTLDGALQEIDNVLHRCRELCIQAANDTNNDDDRKTIQNELNQLTDEIDTMARNAEFNTRKLFDVKNADSATKIDPETLTNKATLSEDEVLWMQVGANTDDGVVVSKFCLSANDLGLADIDVATSAKATKAIDYYANALNIVSDIRSYYGAMENRFGHSEATADNTSENLQTSESKMRDTNYASTMVAYSASNILHQAGQAMLAQNNESTRGVLTLLQ